MRCGSHDPDETCDAVNVYSREVQNDFGASGQLTWVTKPWGHRNQFTVGGVFDRGTVNYTQNTQYGYLLPDGAIVGVPAWQDGSTSVDGSPVDSAVNLHGVTPNGSFLPDRHVFARQGLERDGLPDALTGPPSTTTTSLTPSPAPVRSTGDYTYSRFNPSVGITYNPMLSLEFVCKLLPGKPRADLHRARLRRSQ